MMSFLITLALFIAMWLIGYFTLNLFPQLNRVEKWGLSGLIGTGLTTLSLLVTHAYFHIPFTINLVVGVVVFLITMGSLIAYMARPKLANIKLSLAHWSNLEKILAATIISLVFMTSLQNFTWPVTDWDAIALYDFRAKVLAESGDFLSAAHLGYYFQYPPYTSYLHAMLYVFQVPAAKPLYSFLFGSLLLTFYGLLRKNQARSLALLATLFLAVTPLLFEHATVAYTNLPYTIFFGLGVIYLWQWLEKGEARLMLLGSGLIGLASWVRSAEPFWMLALLLLVWGGWKYRRQWSLVISSICILVGLTYWWPSYDVLANPLLKAPASSTDAAPSFISQLTAETVITHVVEVTVYLSDYILPFLGALFAVTIFSTLYDWYCHHLTEARITRSLTVLALLGMIFAGTFIFSFTFETWNQIGGSVTRLSMFFIPLLIYHLFNSSLWDKNK